MHRQWHRAEAERYQRLGMEAIEARYRTWLGRSSVRSLAPGTRLDLVGLPLAPDARDVPPGYAVTEVSHVGINNLSGEAIAAIAERQLTGDASALANSDAIMPVA